MIAALEVLMEGSLKTVTLPELGSLELRLQLRCILQVPLFGRCALFFHGVLPK